MIRVYNVGAANLTLVHNATSTAANRIFSATGADIVVPPKTVVDLTYDATDNGSGVAGWKPFAPGSVAANAITATSVASGTGNSLTIAAGSGAGIGKGGDVILQPGAQGSSGGNGTTIIKGQFVSLGDFGSTTRVYFGGTNSGTSILTGGGNAIATLTDQYGSANFQWGGGTVVISNGGAIRLNATTVYQFNGITSSFPALKQVGTQLQVRLADDSADASLRASYIRTPALTVNTLPAAATAGAGSRAFVSDATLTTFATVPIGGGANGVPVYSDGTDWRIG